MKNAFINPNAIDYIHTINPKESPCLQALRQYTHTLSDAVLQIPPQQGQFMAWLCQTMHATHVIDIGTYTGYSALALAHALPPEGKVISCDNNPQAIRIATLFAEQYGLLESIDFRLGEAAHTLDTLIKNDNHRFDFIFIDADKDGIQQYFEQALLLIRRGGIIAIDNTLLFGTTFDRRLLPTSLKTVISDQQINTIKAFNQQLNQDNRVSIMTLPIADGLTLARKC